MTGEVEIFARDGGQDGVHQLFCEWPVPLLDQFPGVCQSQPRPVQVLLHQESLRRRVEGRLLLQRGQLRALLHFGGQRFPRPVHPVLHHLGLQLFREPALEPQKHVVEVRARVRPPKHDHRVGGALVHRRGHAQARSCRFPRGRRGLELVGVSGRADARGTLHRGVPRAGESGLRGRALRRGFACAEKILPRRKHLAQLVQVLAVVGGRVDHAVHVGEGAHPGPLVGEGHRLQPPGRGSSSRHAVLDQGGRVGLRLMGVCRGADTENGGEGEAILFAGEVVRVLEKVRLLGNLHRRTERKQLPEEQPHLHAAGGLGRRENLRKERPPFCSLRLELCVLK
mmetsp:Transcript_26529/g.66911  ORF Transcript_26529/g.66911 Transcript_26529/m.66911 type:complete len:339 (-) Transcript_26529:533-1549(-)